MQKENAMARGQPNRKTISAPNKNPNVILTCRFMKFNLNEKLWYYI
jgi:hypothetical protein